LHFTFKLSPLPLLNFNYYENLISELMVTHLDDSMVSTRDGSADIEATQPDRHSSSPSSLAQVIASIHESRVEQTELLHCLVTNSNRDGTAMDNAQDQARSSYVEFLATQPPTFTEASEWAEFREAFRAQHIPVGIMKSKHQEFMNLQQGDRSVYAYSKLFNHLAQYAP
jgi:hypothetical protein